MGQSNDQLAHFKKARRELALVTRIDEVKEIRDKAEGDAKQLRGDQD